MQNVKTIYIDDIATLSSPSAISILSRKIAPLALMAAVLMLIYYRAPILLTEGRFWAEEAYIYFNFAISYPWQDVILLPHLGYYSLFSNVTSLIAAYAVPLEYSPLVTTYAALLVQLIPAWLICYTRIPELNSVFIKSMALGIILFIIPSYESWLNSINSQFHFSLACALILISREDSLPKECAKYLILLIAGLTGVVSLFLIPTFLLAFLLTRENVQLKRAALLILCALPQLYFVISAIGENSRSVSTDFHLFLPIVAIKSLCLPLLGYSSCDDFINHITSKNSHQYFIYLSSVFSSVFFVYLIYHVIKLKSISGTLLFSAAFSIVFLSFAGALGNKEAMLNSWGSSRYYYVPNALFYLLLLFIFLKKTDRFLSTRIPPLLLVGVCLITGSMNYIKSDSVFTGPSWKKEVSLWRSQTQTHLRVWPEPWHIIPPPDTHIR